MNKADLIGAVAEQTNISKKNTDAVLSAILSNIEKALVAGDRVQLVGFGTFEVRSREARTGRNPKTGKEISIPASRAPAFKAGKSLKEAVN